MIVAYCDNEMHCIDDFIKNYKDVFKDDDINFYTSPDELMAASPVPDVIFMDMEFDGEKTGLDYAEKICTGSPETKIIAVTAYSEKFIQDAFLKQINISGFLSKPVQREYMIKTVDKIRREIGENSRRILLCEKGNAESVYEREIIFAESMGHRTSVHTDRGVFTVRCKLSDFGEKLSDKFIACHRSYLVNMARITVFRRESITMEDGSIIPVSRSQQHLFKERYYDYVDSFAE